MSELAKAYDPLAIEEKWAKYWVQERLFEADTAGSGKPFTMLLPPPNVTGRLHMGHMLNQTEMDILTRWHRMRGDRALWVPGTDHAGIATQMMVEKQLAAEGGPGREAIGREAFLDRVWTWKAQYGGAITEQMRRLGASVDWSREYFTMDARLSEAVIEAFVRLWEQGLVYRGAYIVNWDPAIRTAVSDLEVEHEERIGKIYTIRYPLADGSGSIDIATTRPETMLGDTAVAVNPGDERYRAVVGKMVRLPLVGRVVPIVADDWAQPEFGTGAVKVTPAHDPNDFAIGQRHGLPSLTMLDEAARVALPGSPYDGLDRYVARERIVADLHALGLLLSVKDHAMSVGLSQRSGSVIEPRLSDQWFIRIGPLAERAKQVVEDGSITFTPAMYRKVYMDWMDKIHDWCVSRQLWWGHRIPAWYCGSCSELMVARTAPEVCSKCGGNELRQETDVLDTWFSSGLLPFTVFGWPGEDTPELAALYPTDVLVTGFDILFFWVARMIMLGTHFMAAVPMPDGSARPLSESVPFREVYIHALVRAEDRQKMSKTKGNVVDPIDTIARFGTDAVRFTLASMASPGTDIAFSPERTEGYRAFANKIWNAARFVLMNVDRARETGIEIDLASLRGALQTASGQALEARWIATKLSSTSAEVDRALEAYRFDEAATAVYQFFWGDFCDWYVELVKLRLNFDPEGDRAATHAALLTLLTVFEAALRLLSPFMPFLTEEVWHALYQGKPPARSIALTRYPVANEMPADETSARTMATLQELVAAIRGVRKEAGVPEKEAAPIRLFGEPAVCELAQEHEDVLTRLARVSLVEIASEPLTGNGVRNTPRFDVQVVYRRVVDIAAERERLKKDLAKYQKGMLAAEKQLGNEGFIARAPEQIVEGLRRQADDTRSLYEKTATGLRELDALV